MQLGKSIIQQLHKVPLGGSVCYLLIHKTHLYAQDLNKIQPKTYLEIVYIISQFPRFY